MNLEYASRGKRFLAALVDGLVIFLGNVLIGFVLGLIMGKSGSLLGYGAQILLSVGYYVFYQQKMGQTLGKKAMGMKVVDAQGQKPSLMTFFLREIIGKFVSTIILFIGYLMILWDGKKQGLHDKIAGTYVVKA